MSGRESVGDLIPQDVAEVFAHERQTKGGCRKKRGGSLGRAFSWFKGKKKKEVNANGQSQDFHSVGPKTGKTSPQGHSHAVPKQEDEGTHVPSHVQENVFIEGSRPKYLEDLHTEAQEGLKLLQQEETDNGVDYQDDQSITSTVTRQPDETESDSYRERRGSLSDSTILDTVSQVSTRSAVSTRSSRSGLTRQASTFRPLKSEKKPEKAKARRRHRRTTVMGIPQHVQRELGLDRASWAARQVIDDDGLPNGESLNIHTIDGPHLAGSQEGVRIYLQSVEGLQPVSEDQVQQFPSRAGHTDDLALLQRMGPQLYGLKRPKSLAVPWMTTAFGLLHHPPSPVMSMSPQATYMSKIIPNAVLPPSIDVVEISRNRSRSSVRTVSKSRLLLASPASSRASSRASTMSSASRYNPPHFSDSSRWSHSESSETLVSDTSTISSNSTTRQGGSQEGDGEGSSKETALDRESILSSVSKASRTSATNGKGKARGDDGKQEGPFIRSLSVMKSKRAPAPPSRSYSLHKDKMKRRSRDLTDIRVAAPPQSSPVHGGEAKAVSAWETGSSPMPSSNKSSPGYTADTSSLDESSGSVTTNSFTTPQQAAREEERNEQPGSTGSSPQKQTPQENVLKKTVSPSSGYPSQGGTPTLPYKQTHNSSPGNKRGILAELASIFPRAPSPAASAPSPVIQPQASDSIKTPQPSSPVDTVTPLPSVVALRELFNIPPPPKVCAPPPPPPEVWAQNKRTFELLLGPPAPNNTDTVVRKNPKDRRQQRQSPSTSREGSVKNLSPKRRGEESASEAGGLPERVTEPKAKEQTGNPAALTSVSGKGQASPKVQEKDGLSPVVIEEGDKGPAQIEPSEGMKGNSEVAQKVEQERVQGSHLEVEEKVQRSQLVVEPEKVKVSQLIGKLEKVQASRLVNGKSMNAPGKGLGKVKTEIQTPATEKRTESQPKMDTLSMLSHALARVSPSPSHLPAHYPPLPPSKQTQPVAPLGVSSDSTLAPELLLVYPTGESFWPPPPPPMDLATLGDELDLPLPPPPSSCEEGVVMTEPVPPVSEGTVRAPNPARPAPQEVSSVPQGIPQQPSPVTTERQNQEKKSLSKSSPTPPVEAPTPVVTPSLLQMVKLRSVNNGDQVLKRDQSQGQNQTEVTLRAKQPSNGEAPQKPIRRSLIMTALPPTVTSPSTTVISQLPTASAPEAALTSATVPETAQAASPETAPEAALAAEVAQAPSLAPTSAPAPAPTTAPAPAKFQPSIVNFPSKSSTVTSPTSKSPPASATTPSMRMQEAIRLRTAARSKEGPPSHLSLHSPTSPTGFKSPSSTASFIFAKSTKKVVIETLSTPEAQANLTKNLVAELSSVSNPAKSTDTQKEVAVKVPPPVARKPKPKVTDAEPSVETEHVQTAGQEAQPADNTEAEAPNGTAVSVEVPPSSST
ncbi:uncharacterized protein KIAA1522 homolog isoform X2 [Coregonus clupeaformis]|uniref:uncharacterized protein KIAA1522 homolog isoform X2 n=1 Tax=Coregonus clupeaformis TaxID=59861 RepID=UPI001BDFB51E|nr:uncharacterized protein KIAA1522 homolog isoform X2 [Coregonus clupeaformis]